MDHSLAMSVGHGVADAAHDLEARAQPEPSLAHEERERPGICDQLHHHIRHRPGLVPMHARHMDLRDVRMPQPTENLRLVLKPEALFRCGEGVAEHLHRHEPIGRGLPRLVDAAHAPLSEQTPDREPAEIGAGGQFERNVAAETKPIRPARQRPRRRIPGALQDLSLRAPARIRPRHPRRRRPPGTTTHHIAVAATVHAGIYRPLAGIPADRKNVGWRLICGASGSKSARASPGGRRRFL